MTFTRAVRTCLGKYGTFSGRASRAEYWWFTLFALLAVSATALVDAILHTRFLYCLTLLVLFIPLLAAGSRRLHDSGKSGWLNLLALLAGPGSLALLILMALPADPQRNRYGDPYVSPEDARLRSELAAFHGSDAPAPQ